MKVKIKETGEIVNIAEYAKVTTDKCDSYGDPIEFDYDEVELIPDTSQDKEIDWEQRRFELIKVVLSAYCSKSELITWRFEQIARYTIYTVDELIKELKLR